MSGSWALTTGLPFSAYTYRGPRLGFACGEISAECGSATTVGSAVHYQKVFGISFIVFHLCITEQTRMTDSKLVSRFLRLVVHLPFSTHIVWASIAVL